MVSNPYLTLQWQALKQLFPCQTFKQVMHYQIMPLDKSVHPIEPCNFVWNQNKKLQKNLLCLLFCREVGSNKQTLQPPHVCNEPTFISFQSISG